MDVVTGIAVAPLLFGAAWVGGRTLARHYGDEWEVVGVLLVAASLLVPGAVWGTDALPFIAPVCAAGLLGGYSRRAGGGPRAPG